MNIKLKRTYDAPEADDGYRVLVDRLWPRGIKKENLHADEWAKTIAPTTECRKAFNHDLSALIALYLPIQLNLTAILTQMPLLNSLKSLINLP